MEAIRMHAEITLVENDRLTKLARTMSIEADSEADPEAVCSQA